jgi:hypothetical protein
LAIFMPSFLFAYLTHCDSVAVPCFRGYVATHNWGPHDAGRLPLTP